MLLPKYKGFTQERKIGDYTIVLPDPPNLTKICNYGKPLAKQKFTPEWYSDKEILSWDESKRLSFEEQEWDRRRNGFFFFNNGNIEFLTGTNYFYISWWKIDSGLPYFVDSDRDFFYLWKYTEENPRARGLIVVDRRRGGKTWKGTCVMYDGIAQTPNVLGSIQSKSDTDARKVFDKLVFSWRKLPYFFKPVDVGESHPKSKLEFSEPSKRDTKNLDKSYNLVLDSVIDFTNSKDVALDGTKQFRTYQDEIGKTDPAQGDVDQRINVVKECVMVGTKIVGKILGTTTVERMEGGGGAQFKKIIDKTDPENLMPNGETENGLLRYLNPSYYGLDGTDETGTPFINEFGYTDQTRAKSFLDRRLKAIKTSEDVSSERRKYPQTWRDCFIAEGGKAVFDTIRIEQQLEYNETLPDNQLVRGNFQWVGGIKDTSVEWVPSSTGRWLIAWLPKPDQWNKKIMKYGKPAPGNVDGGCLGLDPFDNRLTIDDRKSDAALYGFRRFDPLQPYDSGIFVTEYVNRPRLPEEMWEQALMQAVFFGWEILIENNKMGTINYFRMRGYENYLMRRPAETRTVEVNSKKEEEYGIPMSGEEARLSLIYVTQSHIGHKVGIIEEEGQSPYMGKNPFNRLLEQWRDFDMSEKWTKYDCLVGAGLALLGSRKALPKIMNNQPIQFFQSYKYNGGSAEKNDGNMNPFKGFIIRDM